MLVVLPVYKLSVCVCVLSVCFVRVDFVICEVKKVIMFVCVYVVLLFVAKKVTMLECELPAYDSSVCELKCMFCESRFF